ncbi:MAG: carbamoyltransferase [Lysobacterales bacterium]
MIEPWVLGYSASHNGAVCLLHGSELVCAIQEERLTGEKRARIVRLEDSLALNYCLKTAGITLADLDIIVGCHFSGARILGCGVQYQGWNGRHLTIPHHLGHAIGAFAQSGFDQSAILVIDGAGGAIDHLPEGERANLIASTYPVADAPAEIATLYVAKGQSISCLEKHSGIWVSEEDRKTLAGMPRFGSLGGMYSAAAQQIFGDLNDAGKVMGLAASGRGQFPVDEFFQIRDDGGMAFSDAICRRFIDRQRWPENADQLGDLAASVQAALEVGVNHLAERIKQLSQMDNLTYSGGVALNCVANEVLIGKGLFDDVYMAPAAEDSGPAIGAAYHGLWALENHHQVRRYNHDSLGGRYTGRRVDKAVNDIPHVRVESVSNKNDQVVNALCEGEIFAWFCGGSEMGPRALGHRSIIADARTAEAKVRLNERVKRRESFRPFAPLVLADKVHEWFEVPERLPESPLMLRSFRFKPEMAKRVPSAVHHDGTGRLQTLTEDANPDLHDLLIRYFERTGVPIIINTSFNVMGEPIVETPEDALWCLAFTDIDGLMLEDRIVRKLKGFDFLNLIPQFSPVTWVHRTPKLGDLISGALEIESPTPWGPLKVPVGQPLLPLISLISKGQLTVGQVVQALQEKGALAPSVTLTAIYLLRRKQVIELVNN